MRFPDFHAAAPVVRTHDPLAELLGASDGGELDYTYSDVVRLAGHSCPTVAGAFLMGRAALAALFPGTRAERGSVRVDMPAPADHGTTGVIAQVLTLLTGAAGDGGFHGIGGHHRRHGLLQFAAEPTREPIVMRRIDTGTAVAVQLDVSSAPGDPAQGMRLGAILGNTADATTRAAFAAAWQDRVRRLLLEHADDPAVVQVQRLTA